MKRIFYLFTVLICGGSSMAQPIPLFQNFGTITNAIQIDALAFDNRGTFDISSALPYDMMHVISFTNLNLMESDGGFRFDTTLPDRRKPAKDFVNSGTIRSDSFFGTIFFGGFFTFSPSGYIFVNSTNIDNSNGSLEVGSPGLLSLKGKNTDLSRSALIAGDPFAGGGGGFGGFITVAGTNYYLLPSDITDIYGGAGVQTNDVDFQFVPPFDVSSPLHRVFFPGGGTNGTLVSVPQSFSAEFEAFANVDETGDGDKLVQVVFVNTNFVDTNISATVTFAPFFFTSNPNIEDPLAPSIIVEINSSSYDPITGGISTNTITFIDSSAQQTNLVMFTNFTARSNVRPSSYEITTGNFFGGFGDEGNTPYAPELLYDPALHSSNIIAGFYAGYGAQIGFDSTVTFTRPVDPTNLAPRIEISSDNLDLTLTRMRSEGPIIINTKHLISNAGSDISAGTLLADIGSTNGSLRVANLLPENFQRLEGSIYAWSFIWENDELDPDTGETNTVKFHVLILDQEFTANKRPSIASLVLRAPNLVIENDLKLDGTNRFVTENLTFNSVITVGGFDLGSTNFVGVKNFINETNAVFTGANTLKLGFGNGGFDSIVNRGQISANSVLIKSDTFLNSGLIESLNGPIIIQSDSAEINSETNTPAQLRSAQDIEITAQSLFATNSTIDAGVSIFTFTNFVFDPDTGEFIEELAQFTNLLSGKLVLDISDSITDGTLTLGSPLHNFWRVTDGFSLLKNPNAGDLYGTQIETTAPTNSFAAIRHIWAGDDRGPDAFGFIDNVTLGRLDITILSSTALLRFSGTGSGNALYVNHLEINNPSGFEITNSLVIDSNFKIYYRTSNQDLQAILPSAFVRYDGPLPAATASRLVVTAKGLGTVRPNLDGKILKLGRQYVVTAKPGAGQIFDGWSGGEASPDSKLGFVMRPNLVLEANFAPNPFDPVKGTYNGLFSDPTNGVQQESSGFFNLKIARNGSFTGKILLGKPHPFRGTFNSSGHAQTSVRRNGNTPLTLDLQLDLTNNSDLIVGTVSSTDWVASLAGDRANAGVPPVAQQGKYTMAIPGGVAPGPVGDGFGTVEVNAAGGLRFKGTLADGSPVNQKVNLSKNGLWPLYVAVRGNGASIWSWVTFTNDLSSSFQGDLTWIKKAKPGRNYRDGFTNVTSVLGSHYLRPATGTPVLNITNGTVTLSGGDLSAPITSEMTLGANNVVTVTGSNQLSITISLPNGLLHGSFVHPDTQKKTPLKGVVLQEQNNARGFFLNGTNQSGAVILESN